MLYYLIHSLGVQHWNSGWTCTIFLVKTLWNIHLVRSPCWFLLTNLLSILVRSNSVVELSECPQKSTKLDLDLKFDHHQDEQMNGGSPVPTCSNMFQPLVLLGFFTTMKRALCNHGVALVAGVWGSWLPRVRHVDEEVRNYQGWCCSVACHGPFPSGPPTRFFCRRQTGMI